MRTYFAFGSNMARTTLDERGVRAKLVGAGFIPDYRLGFTLPSQRWTGHAADLVPAAGQHAWGVLWDLQDPHSLDPFELRYNRIAVEVTRPANGTRTATLEAFTYIVKEEHRADREQPPAPAYLDRMVTGAQEAGLPPAYLQFLEDLRD